MKRVLTWALVLILLSGVVMAGGLGVYADSPLPRLNAVAYSPTLGLYVAVGNGGAIVTSKDAVHWMQRTAYAGFANDMGIKGYGTTTTYYPLRSIMWDTYSQKFIIAAGKKILTSSDGANWESIDPVDAADGTTRVDISTIMWAGDKYIGAENNIYTSTDLRNWTISYNVPASPKPYPWGGFASDGAGAIFTYNINTLSLTNQNTCPLKSTDGGLTWVPTNFSAQSNAVYKTLDMLYSSNQGLFITAGQNGTSGGAAASTIASSATAWANKKSISSTTYSASRTPAPFYGIATNGKKIVGVMNNGVVVYRNDDSTFWDSTWTWNEITASSTVNTSCLMAIIYAGGRFVAVGGGTNTSIGNGVVLTFGDDDTTYNMVTSLTESQATTIDIVGAATAAVPVGASVMQTYRAVVKDQDGLQMPNEPVTWSIDGAPAGVSVDGNGVLTICNNAPVGQDITLRASHAGAADATLTISLVPLKQNLHVGPAQIKYSDGSDVTSLTGGKTIEFTQSVTSDVDAGINAKLIAALVDRSGKIRRIAVSNNGTLNVGATAANLSVSLALPQEVDGCYLKTFIWDGFDTMVPYSSSTPFLN